MINIFISSTYIDCIKYRNAAKEAIESFDIDDLNIIGMELFGSRKETTLEVCKKEVQKADIYILIVAHRYGSIEKISKKSYTQIEYEEALKKDIPILVYFLNEDVPVLPRFVDKNDMYNKLMKFKEILSNKHTYNTFYNERDLKHKIVLDLSRELNYDYKLKNTFDIKDMKLTPSLYNQEEYIIEFEIDSNQIYKLEPEIISNLGLSSGNAVYINVKLCGRAIYEDTIILIFQNMFAQKLKNIIETNDYIKYNEIEEEKEITIYQSKVKCVFTTYKDLDWDDNNSVYVEREFLGFVVTTKPKKVRTYRVKIDDEIYF